MFDKNRLITEINKQCSVLFDNSTFVLAEKSYNIIKLTSNYTTTALNIIRNDSEWVDVIYWFSDFWIYVNISVDDKNIDFPNVFISISVFKGKAEDKEKKQLLRAEWDNFEDNDIHPQPHWHIYSNQNLEKTFLDFAKYEQQETFVELLQTEIETEIDLKKIHFAMNGMWHKNNSHVHRIENEGEIISWFFGVLAHLKSQLEYIS